MITGVKFYHQTERIESALNGRLHSGSVRALRAAQVDAAFADLTRALVDTLYSVWLRLEKPKRSTELATIGRFINELDLYNPDDVEHCLYYILTSPSVRNVARAIQLLLPNDHALFTNSIANWASSSSLGGSNFSQRPNQQKLAELIAFRGDIAHGRHADGRSKTEQLNRAVVGFRLIAESLVSVIERACEQIERQRRFDEHDDSVGNIFFNIHFAAVNGDMRNGQNNADDSYFGQTDEMTRKKLKKRRRDKRVVCHICGQPGHIAPQCREVTCFKCHRKGHFANQCQSKMKNRYLESL